MGYMQKLHIGIKGQQRQREGKAMNSFKRLIKKMGKRREERECILY